MEFTATIERQRWTRKSKYFVRNIIPPSPTSVKVQTGACRGWQCCREQLLYDYPAVTSTSHHIINTFAASEIMCLGLGIWLSSHQSGITRHLTARIVCQGSGAKRFCTSNSKIGKSQHRSLVIVKWIMSHKTLITLESTPCEQQATINIWSHMSTYCLWTT